MSTSVRLLLRAVGMLLLLTQMLRPPDAYAAETPPPSVTVAPVEVKNVAPTNSYIGRVQAIQSVAIVARVQAFLDKIDFRKAGS